jgi:acetyl esterase/lipase
MVKECKVIMNKIPLHLLLTSLVFFAVMSVAHAGKPPYQMPLPPGTQQNKDISYVDGAGSPDQTLDLYLPANATGKLPVVVWIHGGAWRSGAKGGWCPACSLLTQGYALVDISYRLSFKDDAPWPDCLYDCKAAIRWLRANAGKYNLDADHIGVWGHSAGGHLVTMLGLTNNNPKFEGDEGNAQFSSAVQAVCDWSGPSDLSADFQKEQASGKQTGAVTQLLSGKNPSLATADKAASASPLNYVTKSAPPFIIAHGAADPVVNPQDSVKLDAALKAAGVESTLIQVPNAGHGIGGPDLEKAADDFFNKHLKAGDAQTSPKP